MSILQTLSTTLPVIILVLVGVLIRTAKILKPGTIADIKTLIVNLTLPLVLFTAFATMTFEARFLLIVVIVFAACTLVMFLAARLRAVPGLRPAYAPYLMAGFEAGMLGYAVFGAMYGSANVGKFAVIDLGQVLFVFFVLVTRLQMARGSRVDWRGTLVNFGRTPVIIAILLGMLANLSGFYRLLAGFDPAAALLAAVAMLAGLTTPLVSLVIGYELRFQAGAFSAALQTALLRLALWVGLALAFNALVIRATLGLDSTFEAAVLLMAVLPAPFVIPIYLKGEERGDRDYILNTLSIGTVLALAGSVVVRMVY
jgi:predicted permease